VVDCVARNLVSGLGGAWAMAAAGRILLIPPMGDERTMDPIACARTPYCRADPTRDVQAPWPGSGAIAGTASGLDPEHRAGPRRPFPQHN